VEKVNKLTVNSPSQSGFRAKTLPTSSSPPSPFPLSLSLGGLKKQREKKSRGEGSGRGGRRSTPRRDAEEESDDGLSSSTASMDQEEVMGDDEVRRVRKECELRWRMCHMWALKNRGAKEQERGRRRPPLPRPSQAQQRWLNAGIWAIGRELEKRRKEEEGEEEMQQEGR
jgi:hypothetical protein